MSKEEGRGRGERGRGRGGEEEIKCGYSNIKIEFVMRGLQIKYNVCLQWWVLFSIRNKIISTQNVLENINTFQNILCSQHQLDNRN